MRFEINEIIIKKEITVIVVGIILMIVREGKVVLEWTTVQVLEI